jgi:hypothetical protein
VLRRKERVLWSLLCLSRSFSYRFKLALPWTAIKPLPVACACSKSYSIDRPQSCSTGGFLNKRHDDIKFLFASHCMRAGFHSVELEPSEKLKYFQPILRIVQEVTYICSYNGFLSGRPASYRWCQNFAANAPSYVNKPIQSVLQQIANGKKREYCERANRLDGASSCLCVKW